IEHYLMARRLMNLNVYFHKKKCATEYLLKVLFKLCEDNLTQLGKKINSPVIDYIRLVKANKMKDDFTSIIIDEGFEIYSQLTDHTIWDLISRMRTHKNLTIQEISMRFLERHLPMVFEVKAGKGAYVKQKIEELNE